MLVEGSEIGIKPVVVGTRGLVAGDGAPVSTEKIITGLTATQANGLACVICGLDYPCQVASYEVAPFGHASITQHAHAVAVATWGQGARTRRPRTPPFSSRACASATS